MKGYGAIRKLMIILLMSILGSYCIGSENESSDTMSSFDSVVQYLQSTVSSIWSYCKTILIKAYQTIGVGKFIVNDQTVQIQKVTQSDDDYCSVDVRDNCEHNIDFFNDTWFEGILDLDPAQNVDMDALDVQA